MYASHTLSKEMIQDAAEKTVIGAVIGTAVAIIVYYGWILIAL
jgi:hypothetical protein